MLNKLATDFSVVISTLGSGFNFGLEGYEGSVVYRFVQHCGVI